MTFSDENITDPNTSAYKCPKCGDALEPVNGKIECRKCHIQGQVKVVVATHTWGCTKTHRLHGWHFFEEVVAHPDFRDRGFGIPICAKMKKALIVTATEAADNQVPYRPQETTSDDIKPVFALFDTPRTGRCSACQEIIETYDMPKSTRGNVDNV